MRERLFSFRRFFFVIMATILLGLPFAAQAAAGDFLIDGTPSTDADTLPSVIAALDASPHTITLQTSLTVASGMSISGKDITFDLNGHDLTTNYLYLTNTRIDYTGTGNFRVVGSTYTALFVNGGYAHVTNVEVNVSAGGYDGVRASNGAEVIVEGNVTGAGNSVWGVEAYSGAKVTVKGSVSITSGDSTGSAVYASDSQSSITINGDVSATSTAGGNVWGVSAVKAASVSVTGKISATGGNNVYGVYASGAQTSMTVTGDINATGTDTVTNVFGIYANTASNVVMTGNISVTATGANGDVYGIRAATGTNVAVTGNMNVEGNDRFVMAINAWEAQTVVTIVGDVSTINTVESNNMCILATASASITVTGNVTATGGAENSFGVASQDDQSIVTINGNVKATGEDITGAEASNGSQIIINGTLTATPYIDIYGEFTPADETIPTTKDGYKTYTSYIVGKWSTVWIKDATSPVEALAFVGASSRKVHGAAGTFDLPIDASGSLAAGSAITVEPRSGGANGAFDLVFQFDHAVEQASATITGASPAQSIEYAGNEVILHLTGVPDASRLGIALDANGSSSITVNVAVGFLCGDVNGNRYVQPGDVSEIRTRTGAVTTAANFIYDVDTSGYIQPGDVSIVRTLSGHSLP